MVYELTDRTGVTSGDFERAPVFEVLNPISSVVQVILAGTRAIAT